MLERQLDYELHPRQSNGHDVGPDNVSTNAVDASNGTPVGAVSSSDPSPHEDSGNGNLERKLEESSNVVVVANSQDPNTADGDNVQ